MTDTIESTLTGYLLNEVIKRPNYRLGPQDALVSSGLVDSFHLVDLALFIEETYGVHIDNADLNADTIDTVEQIAGLIRANHGG
ncbi:MAG: acyl carrier protein [Chloroflexota bacterium]